MKPNNKKQDFIKTWWGVVLVVMILSGGFFFTHFITHYGENLEKIRLQSLADTAAASFDTTTVLKLKGQPADTGTAAFTHVRERLKRIHQANPDSRFVYLMALKKGKVTFLADAEPALSPDYSAPGDIYLEAPPGAYRIFTAHSSLVEGPYQDKWGAWVTGLSPLVDPATGQVIAILGIDINARQWFQAVSRYRWFGIAVTLLVLGIVVMLLSGMYFQRRSHLQTAHYNRELNEELVKRQQAEEALKESQRSLTEIIDFLPDATFVIDKAGRVIAWNRAIEKMTGCNAKEMIGKGEYEYAIPFYGERRPMLIDLALLPDDEFLMNHYDAINRQGTILSGEALAPSIDGGKGAYMWGTASTLFNADGNTIGAIQSSRDITERKSVEKALREQERKISSIFRAAPVGIGMVIDRIIMEVNDTLCRMTGYSREELLGRSARLLYPTQQDYDYVGQEKYHQIAEKGTGSVETRWKQKDGTIIDIILSSTPLDTRNLAKGVTFTALDITALKQVEENRHLLEERLQRAEKMEALGLLSGGVAHDLNNILGILGGYSELLLYDIEESSPVRSYATNIKGASDRAAAIIQDMLTLARRGVQARDVVNFNTLIGDFLKTPELEKLLASHSKVKIITSLEAEPLSILGSPVQLGKAIMNLIANAAEAMPNGGLLTITTSNQYLDRPVQGYDEVSAGDYMVLSVSDSGEGISPKDIKQIFEPFYTKKVMGRSGTGLGLSVVWGTVKDHHGYVDVQSEEGKGSTFTLYFPVTREEIKEEDLSIHISEYMGRGETILVVDDVEGQRTLATAMLRKLNYDVAMVPSGEEAVAYLKDHTVDLMVLDMIMDPGMDGLETYRCVLEIHPLQKVVIVSGFSETEWVNAAQALGAGPYVKKPYVMEKLGLAVRKELDRIA